MRDWPVEFAYWFSTSTFGGKFVYCSCIVEPWIQQWEEASTAARMSPHSVQDAVLVRSGSGLQSLQEIAALSEGQLEGKMIAMEAVRSKLMLQNQLLVHRLGRRFASISHLVQRAGSGGDCLP